MTCSQFIYVSHYDKKHNEKQGSYESDFMRSAIAVKKTAANTTAVPFSYFPIL